MAMISNESAEIIVDTTSAIIQSNLVFLQKQSGINLQQ